MATHARSNARMRSDRGTIITVLSLEYLHARQGKQELRIQVNPAITELTIVETLL